MNVTLQFVLGNSWSSRLIAWYGSGYGGFSHVDAVMQDGSLVGARSDQVGGQPPGLRRRPPQYEHWRMQTLVTFPNTEALYPAFEKATLAKVGSGYDKADILGFIIGKPLMQPGHWICSAAQADSLAEVGLLHVSPFSPQQITPTSLFLICTAGGGATYKDLI